MAIVVRRAVTDDAALISSLNADVQAIHAAALPERFKGPGAETFPPSAAAGLLAVLVAETDGAPSGYAYAEVIRRAESSFHHAYDTVYLHHISVRSAHRRCGVGKHLIEAVRAAGNELGISLMTLDVWSFNDDAREFFRRHGFTPYIERLWSR